MEKLKRWRVQKCASVRVNGDFYGPGREFDAKESQLIEMNVRHKVIDITWEDKPRAPREAPKEEEPKRRRGRPPKKFAAFKQAPNDRSMQD